MTVGRGTPRDVLSLVGYRGVGKTTVARLLADATGAAVIDTDAEIVRAAGCSIAEIFAREGEAGFRQRETAALEQVLKIRQEQPVILATGGGLILAEENRRRLREAGPVVWLRAPVETIVERLLADPHSGANRPSLTGRSFTEEIAEVLSRREPVYREVADFSVETGDVPAALVAERILDELRSRQSGNAVSPRRE